MRYFDATSRNNASFYTGLVQQWTVLQLIRSKRISFFESRTKHIIVPKFYHDGASYGFLQHLRYLGEIQGSYTVSELGRAFYVYKSNSTRTHKFLDSEIDWNFADKYSPEIGLTIRGFEFTFPNLENSLKATL